MQRFSTPKLLAAAGVVLGALGATSAAHARSDVYFSIGVNPYGYVQPAPVYVQPAPVYVQPAPVYVHPYYGHQYQPQYRHHHRRHSRLYGPNGDLDRDGIRNQYDRDRDGDGVRNRFDRAPNNGWHY